MIWSYFSDGGKYTSFSTAPGRLYGWHMGIVCNLWWSHGRAIPAKIDQYLILRLKPLKERNNDLDIPKQPFNSTGWRVGVGQDMICLCCQQILNFASAQVSSKRQRSLSSAWVQCEYLGTLADVASLTIQVLCLVSLVPTTILSTALDTSEQEQYKLQLRIVGKF